MKIIIPYFHMHSPVSFLTEKGSYLLKDAQWAESRTNLPTPGLVHFLLCHTPLQKGMPPLKFGEPRSRSISLVKRLSEYHVAIKMDLYVLERKDAQCRVKKVSYGICVIKLHLKYTCMLKKSKEIFNKWPNDNYFWRCKIMGKLLLWPWFVLLHSLPSPPDPHPHLPPPSPGSMNCFTINKNDGDVFP